MSNGPVCHPRNPLIVQGDRTVLVELDSPLYPEARDALAGFAELVKSPEHIHTYQITPLSIWNACALGENAEGIVTTLHRLAKYPVPDHVAVEIRETARRYGALRLTRESSTLVLTTRDLPLAKELARQQALAPILRERRSPLEFVVAPVDRGALKRLLMRFGFPLEDLAGYQAGENLPVELRPITRTGLPFAPRPYQREAALVFHAGGHERGGSGVVVLPCGAGKTIVGALCMTLIQASTLILVTSVTAARQWKAELLDKTTLTEDLIGEYNGDTKEVRPVTIATYNVLTYRRRTDDKFIHFDLFDRRDWGLIIYDEVHLLPAPVFQVTASLQARRRLGLTATLVREDRLEGEVFALIGPKKCDVPWKQMEKQGWIARAVCTELRVPLSDAMRMEYAVAEARHKFRIASASSGKLGLVRQILKRHPGEAVLIIGMYLEQIESFAHELGLPLITGSTPQAKRDDCFARFRQGLIRTLVVSKVANFSIDLPDAAVAIQVSGMFGSRQEEAQRLGRILRPKPGANQAHFYSIISRDTNEQDFAMNRQRFLCEQGYQYRILTLDRPDSLLPAGELPPEPLPTEGVSKRGQNLSL